MATMIDVMHIHTGLVIQLSKNNKKYIFVIAVMSGKRSEHLSLLQIINIMFVFLKTNQVHPEHIYLQDKKQWTLYEPRFYLCWGPPATCCPWRREREDAPCHTSVPAGCPSDCPRRTLPRSHSHTRLTGCSGPPGPWRGRRVWCGTQLLAWCSSGSWCCLGRCLGSVGCWSCHLQLTGPAGIHLFKYSCLEVLVNFV